jgi:hypothetical protein
MSAPARAATGRGEAAMGIRIGRVGDSSGDGPGGLGGGAIGPPPSGGSGCDFRFALRPPWSTATAAISNRKARTTPPSEIMGPPVRSGRPYAGAASADGGVDAGGGPDGVAEVWTAGGVPVCTPAPLASRGRMRIQPGDSASGSVNRPPSGCVRSLFRSKISVCRSPFPRVFAAISKRYSRCPADVLATT